MVKRVAINGLGRIGRQLLQAGINDKEIEFVAINDLTDTKTLAHLLNYDSVHGKSPIKVTAEGSNLVIGKKKIPVYTEKDPSKLPWKQLKVDIVAECTGFFETKEKAALHLDAGAKKVFISAPSKDADYSIVLGVNHKGYDKKKHTIISNGSCTTNGLAPMVKVLNDKLGIIKGTMITTHAYTATQKLVDSADKDLRRARAAAINIVPTSTGAARALGQVIPELAGKMDGYALRVPVADGSIVTITAEVKRKTTTEEVNKIFQQAEKELKGILQYTEEPIVSSDIIHNPHSSIIDGQLTNVIGDNLVMVSAWYDNEWGFSCRMIDVLKLL